MPAWSVWLAMSSMLLNQLYLRCLTTDTKRKVKMWPRGSEQLNCCISPRSNVSICTFSACRDVWNVTSTNTENQLCICEWYLPTHAFSCWLVQRPSVLPFLKSSLLLELEKGNHPGAVGWRGKSLGISISFLEDFPPDPPHVCNLFFLTYPVPVSEVCPASEVCMILKGSVYKSGFTDSVNFWFCVWISLFIFCHQLGKWILL